MVFYFNVYLALKKIFSSTSMASEIDDCITLLQPLMYLVRVGEADQTDKNRMSDALDLLISGYMNTTKKLDKLHEENLDLKQMLTLTQKELEIQKFHQENSNKSLKEAKMQINYLSKQLAHLIEQNEQIKKGQNYNNNNVMEKNLNKISK